MQPEESLKQPSSPRYPSRYGGEHGYRLLRATAAAQNAQAIADYNRGGAAANATCRRALPRAVTWNQRPPCAVTRRGKTMPPPGQPGHRRRGAGGAAAGPARQQQAQLLATQRAHYAKSGVVNEAARLPCWPTQPRRPSWAPGWWLIKVTWSRASGSKKRLTSGSRALQPDGCEYQKVPVASIAIGQQWLTASGHQKSRVRAAAVAPHGGRSDAAERRVQTVDKP